MEKCTTWGKEIRKHGRELGFECTLPVSWHKLEELKNWSSSIPTLLLWTRARKTVKFIVQMAPFWDWKKVFYWLGQHYSPKPTLLYTVLGYTITHNTLLIRLNKTSSCFQNLKAYSWIVPFIRHRLTIPNKMQSNKLTKMKVFPR